MFRRCFTIACMACVSALVPEKCGLSDTALCASENAESSLLQTTLVSKVAVDTGSEAARIEASEDLSGAPYPKTPSHAALKLAKMATEDTTSALKLAKMATADADFQTLRSESALKLLSAEPAHERGQLALLMESLTPRTLHMRMHPRGLLAKELPPGFFSLPGCVFVAFLVICFFLARRKRKPAVQTNAAIATTPGRTAPRAARRAFNLMTGAWEEVGDVSPPPVEAVAQTPRKTSVGNSRVRAKSSTLDVRRACAKALRQPSGAKTLETPGDARGIVNSVVSHNLVIPHAPCGGLKALRAVREVLAAGGGEQSLPLEKADLLTRGVTPQCFELLRAAGLKDVGRGLVLAEGSGPKLSSVLAAVDAALLPVKLEPLPALQLLSDTYGSYAEDEVFTYN